MDRLLKILFFAVIVRPIALFVLGLNIQGRRDLPVTGPAILAANHNSHLDTLVLMSLYPLSNLHRVRPVAAADYFLTGPIRSWFALKVLGIIPMDRSASQNINDLFAGCKAALDQGDILVLFPEGSRGRPEHMGTIKKGLFFLTTKITVAPVTPIVMRGLGNALPRGEALFVPFNCDVIIGKPLPTYKKSADFVAGLKETYDELFSRCLTKID